MLFVFSDFFFLALHLLPPSASLFQISVKAEFLLNLPRVLPGIENNGPAV